MIRKLFSLLILLPLFIGVVTAADSTEYYRARVMEVMSEEEIPELPGEHLIRQVLIIRLGQGPDKGEMVKMTLDYSPQSSLETGLKKGDRIVISSGSGGYEFYSYDRSVGLVALILLFFAAALAIGRRKGVRALAGLLITLVVVFKVFIPLLFAGVPVIVLTLFTAILISLFTLLILNGLTLKTLAAFSGVFAGLTAAGCVAFVFQKAMYLSGLSLTDAQMLRYMPQQGGLSLEGLLFAGIVLGALGAVMDVGVELASSMNEIKQAAPGILFGQHIKSGMNVGRDIIGTMTNTLILAYAGASLPLLLLFNAYQWPLLRTINLDLIASEILRGLAGSIGLMITVPATVFVSAFVFKNQAPGRAKEK